MSKRSMAELRKIRKKNKVYEATIAQIESAIETGAALAPILKTCEDLIEDIDEREDFLRGLEMPDADPEVDEILNKFRIFGQ